MHFKGFKQNRCHVLELMLKLQASPEEFGAETEAPLTACVYKEDYQSIPLLLMYGASPGGLVTKRDLSPLHVTLTFALKGSHSYIPLSTSLYILNAWPIQCNVVDAHVLSF